MVLEGRWIFDEPDAAPIRLEVHDGQVASVAQLESPSRSVAPDGGSGNAQTDRVISPGFVDSQVNGYNGSDYSLPDLDPDHIERIITEIAASGATRHIATVVTSPQDRILRNLEMIASTMKSSHRLNGAISAIHLEGPCISEEDGPRGAHDRAFARDPDPVELDEWIAAADGLLGVVTLSPERAGSVAFIETLVEKGIVAAIGHTGATPEQIQAAVAAGATLSTHLGNGSHAMLPRLKNYLWEQLASDELHMGLICDGYHIPPSVVKCLVRAKGLSRTILVSDVALYGGMAPGRYHWGSIEVEVFKDGHLGVADTPYLAGAGHTLSWAIPRFIEFTGVSLADAVRLCTTNPGRLFGLSLAESRPEAGQPADFVQFTYTPGAASLEIETMVRGLWTD